MAKIHVRGGSPLELRFVDDEGKTLAVRLQPKGKSKTYRVINKADGKPLKAVGPKGKNVFREANPTLKTCEIGYQAKLRP